MIIRLGISCLLAACAVVFALNLDLATALLAWTTLVAVLCVGGAVFLARQPIGIATMMGRVGGSFVRWGFRAGRGQLVPAVAISWLIWTVLGFATVGGTLVRAEPKSLLMLLTWTIDAMAFLYVLGVVLTNLVSGGRSPGSLLVIAAVLVAIITVSMVFWRSAENDAAETVALALAGGPMLLLGVGYGIVLAMSVASGRRTNWH